MDSAQDDQSNYRNVDTGIKTGLAPPNLQSSKGNEMTIGENSIDLTRPINQSQLADFEHLQTPTPGFVQASVVDMVWLSFQTATFLTSLGLQYPREWNLVQTIINFLAFTLAWKAYRVFTNSSNSGKLDFCDCYKVFRMIVVFYCFIRIGILGYQSRGPSSTLGDFQEVWSWINILLNFSATIAICCTWERYNSDCVALTALYYEQKGRNGAPTE